VIAAIADGMDAAAIARRIGVAPDHPAVRMITDTWTVLFATPFSGLSSPGGEPIEARIVSQRMCASFELFRRSWLPGTAPCADANPPQARQLDSDYFH